MGEMELFWPVAAVRSKLMDEAIHHCDEKPRIESLLTSSRITGIMSRSSQTGTTRQNQTQRASQHCKETLRVSKCVVLCDANRHTAQVELKAILDVVKICLIYFFFFFSIHGYQRPFLRLLFWQHTCCSANKNPSKLSSIPAININVSGSRDSIVGAVLWLSSKF